MRKKKKNSEQVNLQKLSNFGRIQRNLHIFCAKKKCASFLICFRQLYSWHLRFKASLKKKVNVASLGVGWLYVSAYGTSRGSSFCFDDAKNKKKNVMWVFCQNNPTARWNYENTFYPKMFCTWIKSLRRKLRWQVDFEKKNKDSWAKFTLWTLMARFLAWFF